MFKTRIISLTGALLCASLTVAAAAPTVTTKTDGKAQAERAVNACANAYAAFRYKNVDPNVALRNELNKLPEKERVLAAVICLGYGEGYEDGRRGIS